ncbi:hypothetical protein [Halopiger djelfimassiliensis]|nr:hypothetical protein [Halopiger djelfimassiliensis]
MKIGEIECREQEGTMDLDELEAFLGKGMPKPITEIGTETAKL